jgi:hypothetical protein
MSDECSRPAIRAHPEYQVPESLTLSIRVGVPEADWIRVEIEAAIEYNRRVQRYGVAAATDWAERISKDYRRKAKRRMALRIVAIAALASGPLLKVANILGLQLP